MFAAHLPALDTKKLWERLRSEYNIEVLTHVWNDQSLLRASFQAYNSQSDADALLEALEALIPAMRS
jgi:selenocysteine lyase/cysteine desulfurase